MAKKNQLPSGSFRVQVYDYTDVHGKKHYKSFTGPSKKQAQALANEWKTRKVKPGIDEINIYDTIGRYIDAKKAVLSPSTHREYMGLRENYFTDDFGRIRLYDLSNPDIQFWVSELSRTLSPKTVRNAHALLTAALDMFYGEFRVTTTLPAKKRPELYCPSDEDVKRLLDHVKGKELEIAILLAAFGPLRRGEICALTSDDIHGNIITVSKSMVQGPGREWIIKQPKTYGSYRNVEFPDFVINRLEGIEGQIVKATPEQISNRFRRAIRFSGSPQFRFHDLRHYSASIMHAIGVPDQYIMQRGGWASDHVMKAVYRNAIDAETERQAKKINAYFSSLESQD